jgi:pimeloyl-ACP methyl ester carboxylesterase
MMRSFVSYVLLLALAGAAPVRAQTPAPVHADVVIPQPAPRAPLNHWVAAGSRTPIRLDAGNATLRGWSYAGTDATLPTVLFFNANPLMIDQNDRVYRAIAAQGPRVVVFDYRGYGFSTGTPHVTAFQRDALTIYDRLALENHRIVVYGHSLGSALAAYVAAHRHVAGTILVAPFASAREELPIVALASGVAPRVARAIVPAPDAAAAYDEVGLVADSGAPLLVLHGTADTGVPIAQGREVFAAAVAPRKRFVELPGVTHLGAASAPGALDAVRRFIASLRD